MSVSIALLTDIPVKITTMLRTLAPIVIAHSERSFVCTFL